MNTYKNDNVKPCMKIKLTNTKPEIFESKVGGLGYIPHNGNFPVAEDGNQLRLLAQIDCRKIQLDEFPKTGLLQFWILNDEISGLDFDNPTNQNTFRIIYYPEIDKTVTEEEIFEKFVKNEYDEEEYMPVFGEYSMDFDKSENRYIDYCSDLSEEEWNENSGHKVGGYPYFTQTDPRNDEKLEKYDFLLFQLDTDGYNGEDRVMWGDSGIGNFFINSKKLKNLDFSDVLYNWDCC